jgi:hypothetical protein
MSRGFTFGVLAILAILLGVMSYIVKTPQKQDPTPAEQQEMQQMQKKAQAEQMKERRKMMETMQQKMKEQAKKEADIDKEVKAKVKASIPAFKPKKNTPNAGQMYIAGDWFDHREPGKEGVQQMQKIEEARKAAEAKRRAIPAPKDANIDK